MNNTQTILINIIYLNINNNLLFNNYFKERVIFVIINKNVIKINNLCFN